MNDPDQLKQTRFRFLHALYVLSGARSLVWNNIIDIQDKGKITDDLLLSTRDYLVDEGLINWGTWLYKRQEVTPEELRRVYKFLDLSLQAYEYSYDKDDLSWMDYSPLNDHCNLTHEGVKEVEKALNKPEDPTEHFPARISYTINVAGDMIRSVIDASPVITEFRGSKPVQEKVRILFVSANPRTTQPLQLIKECNNVRDRIMFGEYGDQFDFDQRHEVSVSEMDKHLLDYKPQVLHFSGHGSSDGIIIFEDSDHEVEVTSIKALSDLFRIVNGDQTMTEEKKIKLVFLSACYSQKQAEAISRYVDSVVGMSTAVTDEAARVFAESFYQAIGYGKSIKTSFDLGCNKVARLKLPEEHTPKLLHRPALDPSTLYLIKR